MNMRTAINGLTGCLISLILPLAASAASSSNAKLDGILVSRQRVKTTRNPQVIVNWLKLLEAVPDVAISGGVR